MQLTNAEVDKAKAIREIMKNGVVGEGATRIGVGRLESTFQSKPFNNATTSGVA